MGSSEVLEKLFFELASESRLTILEVLQAKNLRMNEVARRLNVTATEAFRQLQRLSDAMLVQKQPEGTFTITGYGKLVLQLSSSFDFVSNHKEYFANHDVWSIPLTFINRISELSKAKLVMDAMENISHGEKMFTEADQFAWGIGESRVPELMDPIITEKMLRGLELKMIIPETDLKTVKAQPPLPKNVELRGLADIPVVLGVTETEATICFRFNEGRIDYAGFSGTDPAFLNWSKELFMHYWQKAKLP